MRRRVSLWSASAGLVLLDVLDLDLAIGHTNAFTYVFPVLSFVTIFFLFYVLVATFSKSATASEEGDWEPYPDVAQTQDEASSAPTIVLVPSADADDAAELLGQSLVVDGDRLTTPARSSFEPVRLELAGSYGRSGYGGSCNLQSTGSSPTDAAGITWRDNSWGAIIDRKGTGNLLAGAYRFTDERFNDAVVLPLAPSGFATKFEAKGSWRRRALESTISIDGAYLTWALSPPEDGSPQAYALVLRWKYGTGRFDDGEAKVVSEVEGRTIRVKMHPSQPVFVVAHRKHLTPLNLVKALTDSGLLNSLLISGHGLGKFDVYIAPAGSHRAIYTSDKFTF